MFGSVPFSRYAVSPLTPPPPPAVPQLPLWFVGVDLGQTSDPTAIACVEKSTPAEGDPSYAVRHLERLPLGTPYPKVVDRVVELFAAPPLTDGHLVVDWTGVGRPVVDMIRQAGPKCKKLVPITITAGTSANPDGRGWRVPKVELVSSLQVLLQERRLKVAAQTPAASAFVSELQSFKVKITPALNETFGAWRDGEHDDLVLAVACAAWVAVRHVPRNW